MYVQKIPELERKRQLQKRGVDKINVSLNHLVPPLPLTGLAAARARDSQRAAVRHVSSDRIQLRTT